MAEYKSQYPELGFYANDEFKQFSGGKYVTEDKGEIEVLDKLLDATRVDEPKPEPKTEPKATPRKTATKK